MRVQILSPIIWGLLSLQPMATLSAFSMTTTQSSPQRDFTERNSENQFWSHYSCAERWSSLTQVPVNLLPGYYERVVPYLLARGESDEISMEQIVSLDLLHLAHALNLLFEEDSTIVLQGFLGNHFSLVEGYNTRIDHVGRELYGPLSFYLPLLKDLAPELNLIYLRDLVFPSTQVVKALQERDPSLRGVTIGRVYFQSLDRESVGCLELFQAAPLDERDPQGIEAIEERMALLKATVGGSKPFIPIDHLAIELDSAEEVRSMHERIKGLSSDTLQLNQREVSYNPGDGSTQTKAIMRNSTETPFNRIMEFVHYSKE